MPIRIDQPYTFFDGGEAKRDIQEHTLLGKWLHNLFAKLGWCSEVVTIHDHHINVASFVEWAKKNNITFDSTDNSAEKIERVVKDILTTREITLLEVLIKDRLHHKNVHLKYDPEGQKLFFIHQFKERGQDITNVFHARWAETMVTLGGKYHAPPPENDLHSFENDPHNAPYWQQYNGTHFVKIDGKAFVNKIQAEPEKEGAAIHIDHKALSTIEDITNRFLTRKVTDFLISHQNEEYYKANVQREPKLGKARLEDAPLMSDDDYKKRFHPVTGAGPNRFRAYAQKRGPGYKVRAFRNDNGHLQIAVVKGDPAKIRDACNAFKKYFPNKKITVSDKNELIIEEPVSALMEELWQRRIHFAGSVVVDPEGRIQVGYRFNAGYATGGGFSSDFFSKMLTMERDSIDEFGAIGVRPGEFLDLYHKDGTYVGMVDTENLSNFQVGVATDEFYAPSIDFFNVVDLRKIAQFRDIMLKINLPAYLDKEAELIAKELKRIHKTENVEVIADKSTEGDHLSPTWGNLTIRIDGKETHYIDQNPGKLRKELAST